MIVVICPGIHPPELTTEFVAALEAAIPAEVSVRKSLKLWVLPADIAPYAPALIHAYVEERWQTEQLPPDYPTAWIGFSAGVVGAVAAARRWQRDGGEVRGLIAVDGWGVPLGHRFPRFRLSHDRFTAQSCEWLGASDGYFYCDPAVEHLELWRSPQQSWGQWHPNLSSPFEISFGQWGHGLGHEPTSGQASGQGMNAANLLEQLLRVLADGSS